MALPTLPPRLKSAFRPLTVIGSALGPTGIGVVLSFGAHAGLIAASVQNGGADGNLFGAFDEAAAAEAAAEERSVPIVQLTPAERDRLPAFAQPRPDPLSSSSLSSLALPPGLPVPNSVIQPRRTPTRANRMPSATSGQQARPSSIIDIKKLFPDQPITAPPRVVQPPTSITLAPRTPASDYIQTEPSVTVPSLNENQAQTDTETEATTPSSTDDSGLQQLDGLTTAEALARLQGIENQPAAPETTPPEELESNPQPPEIVPEGESVQIPIENNTSGEVPTLALNPADGAPAELLEELTYDDTLVSPEAVEAKVDNWSEEIVAARGPLPTETAEVGIRAAFKACRETPPQSGLIGVIVNQDGTLEGLDVLRSTGYETLNLRAREAVENYDFGEVSEPTQYQIEVEVDYDKDGCVDVDQLKERLGIE